MERKVMLILQSIYEFLAGIGYFVMDLYPVWLNNALCDGPDILYILFMNEVMVGLETILIPVIVIICIIKRKNRKNKIQSYNAKPNTYHASGSQTTVNSRSAGGSFRGSGYTGSDYTDTGYSGLSYTDTGYSDSSYTDTSSSGTTDNSSSSDPYSDFYHSNYGFSDDSYYGTNDGWADNLDDPDSY